MDQYFFQCTTAVFALLSATSYLGLCAQKRQATSEKLELEKKLAFRTLERDENALFFFWVQSISSLYEVQQISNDSLKRFQILYDSLEENHRSLREIGVCNLEPKLWLRFQPVASISADLLELEAEIAARAAKERLTQMLNDLREKAMHAKVFFDIEVYQRKIDAL